MSTQPAIGSEQHTPDSIPAWLLDQHQVWVDFFGKEHEIETMPVEHARQAIAFCRERADRLWQLHLCQAIFSAIGAHLLDMPPFSSWPRIEQIESLDGQSPQEWLEQTPLLLALKRRADLL